MTDKRKKARVAYILTGLLLLAGALACQVGKGAAPTVEITFPPAGRQVELGAVVPIHSVSRDDRGLARVELWSGGQVVQTTPASGSMYVAVQQWTATQVGVVNVGVTAVDSDGQSSQPAVVDIEVVASASEISEPIPEAPEAPLETPIGAVGPIIPSEAPLETPAGSAQPTIQSEGPPAVPGAPVDLQLTNLTLSNVNPAPGEEIVVGVTILNAGGAAAEHFQWGWDPGTGQAPIQSEVLGPLVPGDDLISEMRFTYQEAGQYSAHAWADSLDAYAEPDETNNFAYEDVNVRVAGAVDLAITNLTLSNLNPEQGEEIVVGVTIMNVGGSPAQDFHWSWDPGTGEGPIQSEAVAQLAPGDDVVLEMPYTYEVSGDYVGEAKADSFDAYAEANETDNLAHVDVSVRIWPTYD
jgi:hypothetical protein